MLIISSVSVAIAATPAQLQKELEATRKKEAQLKKDRLKKEADAAALDSLLKRINTNISATTSALNATAEHLNETNQDLESTTNALKQSEEKLFGLKDQLEILLGDLYQVIVSESPLLETVAARNISEQVEIRQYRDALNAEFDKLVGEEEHVRSEISETKTKLEEKQSKLSQLKNQQTAQKNGLESEQKRKNSVLANTTAAIADIKAEEAKLADREREVEALIQAELAKSRQGGKFVGGLNKPVKQGDVIGYQGNTGYSTGSHLHFTVLKNCEFGQTVNPTSLLGGALAWPLSDYNVTQGYGMTDFARAGAYRGAIHNGIDIQQYPGAPIRAAAAGTIRLQQYFGGYGNAVIIEHTDNLCTLYGHMS